MLVSFNSHCYPGPQVVEVHATFQDGEDIGSSLTVLVIQIANYLWPIVTEAASSGHKNARGAIHAGKFEVFLHNVPANEYYEDKRRPKFLFNLTPNRSADFLFEFNESAPAGSARGLIESKPPSNENKKRKH
jgi:hypothetical protein